MSAFQELASPAPNVEPAMAERAEPTESLKVDAAIPCEDLAVSAARQVEPAVPYDDPKKFAPPMTEQETSHISVKALRSSGCDFEGICGIIQGGVERSFLRRYFPLCFDYRDFVAMGEITRYVFVRGNCIFVYGQETDSIPLYAIQLEPVRPVLEDPQNPDYHSYTISPQVNTNEARKNLVTILLKDRTSGQIAYQFTFDTTRDKSIAKRFLDIVERNCKHYGSEVVTASVVKSKS